MNFSSFAVVREIREIEGLKKSLLIEGTEVLHRTGPIFEVDEHNPLRANNNLEGPTMFLFSISTATY